MFLLGMTKSEIADELNKRKVMTPALYKKIHNLGYTKPKKDNKWDYERVDRILRDENYPGTLVQGKRRNENYITHKEVKNPEKDWIKFENHYEAIVDKEKLDKVQEILDRKSKVNKDECIDILSGILKCKCCGSNMIKRTSKGKVYYCCSNYYRKKNCENNNSTSKSIVDEFIKKN